MILPLSGRFQTKGQRQFAQSLKTTEDYLTQKSQPSSAKLDTSAESEQDTSILSTLSGTVSVTASASDEYADLRKFSPNELVEAALIVRRLIYQTNIQLEKAPTAASRNDTFTPFLKSTLERLEEKKIVIANYMYENHLKPSMDKKEISDEMKSKINLDTLELKNLQPDLVKIGETNPLFDPKNLSQMNIVSFMDQYAKLYSSKLKENDGVYVASIDPETLKAESDEKFEEYLEYKMLRHQKSVIMIGSEIKESVGVSLETAEKQGSEVPVEPTKAEALSTTTPDSEEKPIGFFDNLSKHVSSGLSAIQTATDNVKQTVKKTTEKIIASNETPSKPISPSEKVKKLSKNLKELMSSREITFDAFQINEEPDKAFASKVFFLYAQIHKIENENQGKPIRYEFFTNPSEENTKLADFLAANSQLIPKGMIINFTDKNTKAPINAKFIIGTGVLDENYQETVENGLKLENEEQSLNWLKNQPDILNKLEKLKTATADHKLSEKLIITSKLGVIKNVLKKSLDSTDLRLKTEGEKLYHATLEFIESAINPLLSEEISAESANNINNACVVYMATMQTLNDPDHKNLIADLHKKTTELLKTKLKKQENEKIKSFVGQLTLVKLSDILYREGQIPQPIINFLETKLEDSLKTLRESFIKRLEKDRNKKWDEPKTTENLPEFYTAENDQTEVAVFCRQTQNFINEVLQPWAEVYFGGQVLDEKIISGLEEKYKTYQTLVEKLPDGIPEKKAAQNLLKDVNSLRILQRRINYSNEKMLKNPKVNSKIIKSSPSETEKDNDSLHENLRKSILEQQRNFLQKIEKISENSNLAQLNNISNFVLMRERFTNKILDLLDSLQKMPKNPSENDFQKITEELETFQKFLEGLKNSIPAIPAIPSIPSIPITDDISIISEALEKINDSLTPETIPKNLIEDTETLTKTFSEFFEKLENSLLENIFKNKLEKLHNVFLSDLEKLSKTNKFPFLLIEDELASGNRTLYVMLNFPEKNLETYNNHYILKEYPQELFYIKDGIAEKLNINAKDEPGFYDLLDTLKDKMQFPEVPSCPWHPDLDLLVKFPGYSRILMYSEELPKIREKDVLYLLKTRDGDIRVYPFSDNGTRNEEFETLSQWAITKLYDIKKLPKFPEEKTEFAQISNSALVKEITAICDYTPIGRIKPNPKIYLMEKIPESDLTPYNGNCIATEDPARLFYVNKGKAEQLEINYDDCRTSPETWNRNRDFLGVIDALYLEAYASRTPETIRALQAGEFSIPQTQRLVRRLDAETRKVDSYPLDDLPQPARSSLLNTIQSNPDHLIKESLTRPANETYQHILSKNENNPEQLKRDLNEYTQKIETLSKCSEKLTETIKFNLSVFDPNYDEKLQAYENALHAYNEAWKAYEPLNNSNYYNKFHNSINRKVTEFAEEIKQNATIFTALSFLTLSLAYWVVSATRGIRAAMAESETDAKNIPDVEPNREYELSHQSPTVKQTSVSTEALGSFSTPLQRQKPREKTDEVRPENPVASAEGKNEAKIVRK